MILEETQDDTEENDVINLSGYTLNKEEISVLKKGLNFVISPKNIPRERIICSIE